MLRYTLLYDMIWHDMIWHDMIWYAMIWYEVRNPTIKNSLGQLSDNNVFSNVLDTISIICLIFKQIPENLLKTLDNTLFLDNV